MAAPAIATIAANLTVLVKKLGPLIAVAPQLADLLKQLKQFALTKESVRTAVEDVLDPALKNLATKADLDRLATRTDLDQRATELEEAVTEMESRLIPWIVGVAAVLAALIAAATALLLIAS